MRVQTSASTYFKVLAVGAFLFIFASGVRSAATSEGGDLFKKKCSMCHGTDGKGFPAMKTPDFTDRKVQASLTDKEITETIKNGRKGTMMPPFGSQLSDKQIQELVLYIRSLKK